MWIRGLVLIKYEDIGKEHAMPLPSHYILLLDRDHVSHICI